jgi:hypothetical protein
LKPSLQPFGLAEGRLLLDGVDLADIAAGLEGRPAWVISAAAVLAAGGAAASGGSKPTGAGRSRPVTVDVAAIGPPAVLALLAQAGCWARAASRHELLLATQAGFPPERLVAEAPLLDDGFVIEALSAGVAVLARRGREAAAAVERIARALGLPTPPARGAPPTLSASAFRRSGGLLSRLLSSQPALALDAACELAGSPLVVAMPGASSASEAKRAGREPSRTASLLELTGRPARRSRLLGRPQRGDWVLVLQPGALAARAPHPAWPEPRTVLVSGGLWRLLDARPLPPVE